MYTMQIRLHHSIVIAQRERERRAFSNAVYALLKI
jgi:hypothetical protein